VQGVIKSYDPTSGDGTLLRDTDLAELDLASDALQGSIFRMLRQGQRVVFDLNAEGQATRLRLGSEVDMDSSTAAPSPASMRRSDPTAIGHTPTRAMSRASKIARSSARASRKTLARTTTGATRTRCAPS